MKLALRLARYGFYVLTILMTLIFLRLFMFQIIIIQGNSMLPTLRNGSIVLVYKRNFPQKTSFSDQVFVLGQLSIRRFDLVLFDPGDGKYLIKRVIGLPGDFYAFRNEQVLIDHLPLEESYILKQSKKPFRPVPMKANEPASYFLSSEGRIPPGYYLLLGDNRKHSYDSRDLGLIPEESLRGKVVYHIRY
ncbi:MAG: signal peptidase I [Leptospiraceae bacterium]|nr:signal peptidase I [Leptospiraceae bacterium]MCP5513536.1 signal peptidase I [Leptospiraceae bacterium]